MKSKFILVVLVGIILSSCVGVSSTGIFGTGVSVALDTRTVGTQIDDSIMQKNLTARILLKDKLETKLTQEAKIMIARSSLKIEDFYTAEKYYTDLEKNASGKLKAEALYHLSLFKNRQKEYIQSNEIVQNLIANYSSHKYWAVKSYVIMGKNYYGLEDVYQATFVLENIMKNFN